MIVAIITHTTMTHYHELLHRNDGHLLASTLFARYKLRRFHRVKFSDLSEEVGQWRGLSALLTRAIRKSEKSICYNAPASRECVPAGRLFDNQRMTIMRVAHTTADKLSANAEAIKRWERKATRALNALTKLRKQRARLERQNLRSAMLEQGVNGSALDTAVEVATKAIEAASVAKPVDNPDEFLAIPGFLKRSKADQEAMDKAQAERDERAKLKAKGQAETRKAKRSGDTKKMPLTGRAALEAIRGG